MYITYEKLWSLLHSKKLTKHDLCMMTGMSTRTLAKLVKNQSVTTDTLLHICDALDCTVNDILEISKEEPKMTLYDTYKLNRKKIYEDEFCILYETVYDSLPFLIKEIKQKMNKKRVLHCRGNSVVMEQLYPAGISAVSIPSVVTDLSFVEKGKVCILLADGITVGITGRDEGRFLSEKSPYQEGSLYVMSKAKFKLFSLPQ
ncbi:MAG: helix-turn-helix transcriptional regulator [Clostridia bacterium]|nr:helix-turn-helix transcriptional regulator [Clostridia bacterium]